MINDANAIYVLGILLLFGLIGLIMAIRSTLTRRGGWGLNFDKATYVCPTCKEQLPVIRKPSSIKQLLWGGWTCKNCGAEVSKWGELINEETTT